MAISVLLVAVAFAAAVISWVALVAFGTVPVMTMFTFAGEAFVDDSSTVEAGCEVPSLSTIGTKTSRIAVFCFVRCGNVSAFADVFVGLSVQICFSFVSGLILSIAREIVKCQFFL
ncbi:MAG: hypothetical protein COX80_03465 [Candidatus Magasanikbacteria bacterium CG_4_10_14_0_2_um_filter_33_14]|uniref:Uncharacterized protein n=1 Tax=Candidatus Magasanikbacteria bacterium CG_4_10_14_0_2_um_filter_33_14 TaxID=1974636 RepID=A0A2M7VA66_9BACT|nr:MAG: hypothetical protein COX80_03465 [Candidatus Magasanikbacteria bacterium CG_4_10_14_0_2_um_filter_33_14]